MRTVLKIFTLLLLVCSFTDCKKKKSSEDEVPPPVNTALERGTNVDLTNLHGYFYSGTIPLASTPSVNTTVYAAFGDPGRKFLKTFDHYEDLLSSSGSGYGNVSVGQVKYKTEALQTSTYTPSTIFYTLNKTNSTSSDKTAQWSIQGNSEFKSFDISFPSAYPEMLAPPANLTLTLGSDFTVNTNTLVSDFDSVVVIMYNNFGQKVVKRGGSKTASLNYTKEQISFLYGENNYGYIKFCAFKYFNITIENRVHLFEFSTKNQAYIQAKQP
jgi:hypothetical protein